MPWCRMFQRAEIERINSLTYKLTCYYSWYMLQDFTEVFLCSSLEEAKQKLLEERAAYRVKVIQGDSVEVLGAGEAKAAAAK